MGNIGTPVTKRSVFSWILPGNIKLQVLLVVIITVTVFARVFPLEMQKRIVNEAINLRKVDLLFLYCGLFLAAVLLASGLKYLINILQTLISERVLANMRKEVYHHILTLPLSFFRKTGPGLVVSSVVTELASAGDFAGMAIAVPITSVLTLLAFAGYLFWLNPWLAALCLSIYPVILFLVPILQKGANRANRRRVDTTRTLSNKITESISGIHEVHGNGAYRIENKKFDRLVEKLLKIRIVWNLYRLGVKVMNNFFTNLSPFLVFILGGYLTIKGRLELGALVAFLSAQEKLYDPWKELIAFYQLYQDASVRYKKTMEYFDVRPEYALTPEGRTPYELETGIEVKDLSFATEDGIRLIDGITFSLRPGEHLAVVGFSGSGKSTLAQCVGQLYKYTGGHVLIGQKEVSDLTKSDMAHNIGFIAQAPFIFDGTIEENLLYSCLSLSDGNGAGKADTMPGRDDIIEV
ncbi:MAG: ABC transporter ATP-binding protein, partial [Deltaproteobacteria bacterium]|nr:ABC transporter ATP-binding protein [Deltaproteobacteria bacterium]